MRLFLDTHTIVWMLSEPHMLSRAAAILLDANDAELFVSAISAYEIGQKFHAGKWSDVYDLAHDFLGVMRASNISVVDVNAAHATLAASLSEEHKDPFDRIIAAQAISMQIDLVSTDTKLDYFPLNRIW